MRAHHTLVTIASTSPWHWCAKQISSAACGLGGGEWEYTPAVDAEARHASEAHGEVRGSGGVVDPGNGLQIGSAKRFVTRPCVGSLLGSRLQTHGNG